MIVGLTGARRILEIGMFTGYSTLAMAEALPKGGTIVACEIDRVAADIAKRYFAESAHNDKIEVRVGARGGKSQTGMGSFRSLLDRRRQGKLRRLL